ncbi:MAG TPA: metallophosphoesterase [Chthoniobacteraceae bacterium]|nr:metallophosphoesterase [Chthoniobacteraceae bacterium]
MTEKKPFRIAATADLHCSKASHGKFRELFKSASDAADVLLLCGDLTDYGLPEEARILAEEIEAAATIPILAVLGNHDFESGRVAEIREIIEKTGVKILDGESAEIGGVGFGGVCGFGGGFGPHMLNAWGEPLIKSFVQEAVDHALRLEQALAGLKSERRVVLLHYSPIRETVVGEDPEIFPFLGSSRLENPLDNYAATVVFHGHAHNGAREGRTARNVPVYNVSLPVLRRTMGDANWFQLFQMDA